MDLNGISCGGYRVGKNKVTFFLYDTELSEVTALDKVKLTLTISSDDTMIFDGYQIISFDVNPDAIRVTFAKKLDDATAKSINALEENYQTLRTMVVSNNDISTSKFASLQNVIAPIIMRENITDKEAFDFQEFYPSWQVGFDYKKDWIIQYDGSLYRIGQDHTSQAQWIPGSEGTTALYSKISISEEGYETWKEWDGVSGSYESGQIVEDPNDNQLYISKIDSNVWGPPSEQPTYWELYVES